MTIGLEAARRNAQSVRFGWIEQLEANGSVALTPRLHGREPGQRRGQAVRPRLTAHDGWDWDTNSSHAFARQLANHPECCAIVSAGHGIVGIDIAKAQKAPDIILDMAVGDRRPGR